MWDETDMPRDEEVYRLRALVAELTEQLGKTREKLEIADAAIVNIMKIAQDRQRFVMMGPMAFMSAVGVGEEALKKIR